MAEIRSQDGRVDAGGRRARPGLLRLIAAWGRLVVGLTLVGEGGVLYADARTHWAGHGAWVGAAAALIGSLLGLSAVYAIYAQIRPRSTAADDGIPVAPEPSVPMLGALLVYKYRFITEEQLAAALEVQRKETQGQRRIGGILLDMGLLTMAELQEALSYQRSLDAKSPAPERNAEQDNDGSLIPPSDQPAPPESGEPVAQLTTTTLES